MRTGPATILIAEDHTVVREGLRILLEMAEDFRVIGEAPDGRVAVTLAQRHLPDVVVMDLAMSGLNGIEATRRIRATCPRTQVLVLSAHNDDEYVLQMVSAGASGYLVKHASGRMLLTALREVVQGRTVFSPCILKKVGAMAARRGRTAADTLSSREAEVLQLVAEGSANKQVAGIMGISIKTVEKHRQKVMDKLGIHETAGLTRYAMDHGLVARGSRS